MNFSTDLPVAPVGRQNVEFNMDAFKNVSASIPSSIGGGSANQSVSVNEVGISDDYIATVNATKQITVNGF